MTATTAREYATSTIDTGAPVDWHAWERAAYARHPEIQVLLDASAHDHRATPRRARGSLRDVLLFVVEFWPLVTLGLLSIPVRLGLDPAVPFAIAGLGALVYVATRWAWLRPGAEVSAQLALLSIAQVVVGGVVVAIAATTSTGSALDAVWTAALVLMTLAAAVTAIVQIVRGRRGGGRSGASNPVQAARRAVDALPADERASIQGDLQASVAALADAGRITSKEAAHMEKAPLGAFARWRSGLRGVQPQPEGTA